MPLQATSGAASYDAFGGGVPVEPVYIEQIFSTYLYSGTSASQTITNGIDLSTYGGLVWTKARTTTYNHCLTDTIRGGNKQLFSNTTDASTTSSPAEISSFNTTGYTLAGGTVENVSGQNFVGWTFREQPKFFDVVTYTGDSTNRTIAHNLGSVPGCIIVKDLLGGDWNVYHRSLANTKVLGLNVTDPAGNGPTYWNSTTATSTVFSLGTSSQVNFSGHDYVAYIFAHDAGGFGLTGTDNVISCGTFTTDGSSNATITLGYEPQWVLTKRTDSSGAWGIYDTMRGWSFSAQNYLLPNDSGAEGTINSTNFKPTATGFTIGSPYDSSATYIYIAIRRGPMKVPTDATKVFSPTNVAQASAPYAYSGFPVDMAFRSYTPGGLGTRVMDRLRGASSGTQKELNTTSTSAETNTVSDFSFTYNTGISAVSFSSNVFWMFQRAPGFFDEVCYTGNGSSPGQTLNHNLNAVPELIIWKARNNGTNNWYTYSAALGTGFYVELNLPAAKSTFSLTGDRTPTSSVFYTCTGGDSSNNGNNITYVAYLFATCAGVSKVGTYTGNGTTQTINCGFGAGGARFVLIKRTDATGDWYVYDTARGMTVLTDPYLLMNSTAAESATLGSVTTVSTGFAVNASILAAINTNAASYIFLAIA